ncbi:MAG: hypothetical protein LUE89_10650 [Clostridiales bacterium]|nr:hypothetical protein [Clostridiales bacterium]
MTNILFLFLVILKKNFWLSLRIGLVVNFSVKPLQILTILPTSVAILACLCYAERKARPSPAAAPSDVCHGTAGTGRLFCAWGESTPTTPRSYAKSEQFPGRELYE